MPSASVLHFAGAGFGSGWTSPSNITAADGAYSTAAWSRFTDIEGGADPTPTPVINASPLGFSSTGTILGIFVEVFAHRSSTPTGTISAQLAKGNAPVGNVKTLGALAATDTIASGGSSSDLWGATWSAVDISNLSVLVHADPTSGIGAGTVSIDYVRVTVYYENPDSFSFTDLTNQPYNTTVESNAITVTGLTQPAAVTVTSPSQWSKNGGAYTSAPGTVVNGDTVKVRHTTSQLSNTTVNTTLAIAAVTDIFSSTTTNSDTVPDAFSFATQTGRALSSPANSAAATISGINTATPITVSGGKYSINGGAFVSTAGTVNSGDMVRLQVTTSGSFNTSVTATATIGGVNGSFTATTRPVDTQPNQFTFVDVSGVPASTLETSNAVTMAGMDPGQNATVSFVSSGGSGWQYSINGGAFTNIGATTIQNGQTLAVRLTSAAASGASASVTVNVGGTVDTYTVTTSTGDTTPDAFTFVDEPAAGQGQVTISNVITITGIDATANVTFSSSGSGSSYEYRKNHAGTWGAWTALASDTVVNGDELQVQMVAPPTIGDSATITMTVGGVADSYNVTSAALDDAPDQFSFLDVAGASTSTLYTSNAVTLTGLNAPATISVSAGGQYRVNGGSWTSSVGTVMKGDVIEVQVLSSDARASAVNALVTVGSVSDTYSVTTSAPSAANQYVVLFRETVYGSDV